MTTPRITILQDKAEKPSAEFRFSEAVDLVVTPLAVGSYSVAGAAELLAIERKSLDEFALLCGAHREQLLELARRLHGYETRAIVVEGSHEDIAAQRYNSKILPQAVTGSIIALFTDYGIHVILAGSSAKAANFIERACTRVAKRIAAAPPDPLKRYGRFAVAARSRLDAGKLAYGESSFSKDPAELVRELQQECLDLAGWGFVLFERLKAAEAALGQRGA